MDKKLQDLAWQCLPLEVKKEVKRLYKTRRNKRLNEVSSDFIYCLVYLFGKHNLTSDAEGEEMLTIPRSKVQKIWAYCDEILMDDSPNLPATAIEAACAKTELLNDLFGSKCLPDDTKDGTKNDTKEPKPAEPKFKCGDVAVVRGFEHPLIKHDGAIVTILLYHDKGDFYSCAIAPNVGIDVDAKYLEPYTQPTDKNPKENANTFASDESTAAKSDNFGHILNDGFRNHHRLHIATMAMQGLLANPAIMEWFQKIR